MFYPQNQVRNELYCGLKIFGGMFAWPHMTLQSMYCANDYHWWMSGLVNELATSISVQKQPHRFPMSYDDMYSSFMDISDWSLHNFSPDIAQWTSSGDYNPWVYDAQPMLQTDWMTSWCCSCKQMRNKACQPSAGNQYELLVSFRNCRPWFWILCLLLTCASASWSNRDRAWKWGTAMCSQSWICVLCVEWLSLNS